MNNLEIRSEIRRAGFFNYQIAAAIGVSEQAFSHALTRGELNEKRRKEVMQALERLKKEREGNIADNREDCT